MNEFKAKVKAAFTLNPNNSQVVLVTFAIVLGIAIVGAMLLAWQENESWKWFLGFCVLVFICSLLAWLWSQPDTDMQNSQTDFNLPNGLSISTDSRMLKSPEFIQLLTSVLEETLARKPLPTAVGTVDASLNPLPNTQTNAQNVTDKINTQTLKHTNEILDALGLSESSDHLEALPPIDPSTQPPPLANHN